MKRTLFWVIEHSKAKENIVSKKLEIFWVMKTRQIFQSWPTDNLRGSKRNKSKRETQKFPKEENEQGTTSINKIKKAIRRSKVRKKRKRKKSKHCQNRKNMSLCEIQDKVFWEKQSKVKLMKKASKILLVHFDMLNNALTFVHFYVGLC